MQIELPLGSYVPEFIPRSPRIERDWGGRNLDDDTLVCAVAEAEGALDSDRCRGGRGSGSFGGDCGWRLVPQVHQGKLYGGDELWAPLLKSPGQVLFVVGPVLQEALSLRTGDTGVVDSMTGRYDYISVLSAVALTHLTGVLQKQGRTYEMKESTETSLADMRSRPVVLVGAMNNKWTMHIMNTLRFRFAFDGRSAEIQDTQNAQNPRLVV